MNISPLRPPRSLGALLLQAAMRPHGEPGSVTELAAAVDLPRRTLQRRCREAGTTAKACVDFLRCLRAVLDTTVPWDPVGHLSLHGADPRTIQRLQERSRLSRARRPTAAEFLRSQRVMTSAIVLDDIAKALAGEAGEWRAFAS